MFSEKGKTFINILLYTVRRGSLARQTPILLENNFIKTAYCQIRLSLSQCSMRIKNQSFDVWYRAFDKLYAIK